ncbi:hypothetical protein D3C72_1029380 [compost metagenome]
MPSLTKRLLRLSASVNADQATASPSTSTVVLMSNQSMPELTPTLTLSRWRLTRKRARRSSPKISQPEAIS